MLKFVNGDIVDGLYPVFCHQVNCKGVMGAGLARHLRYKYPEVYDNYVIRCRQGNLLGTIQPVICHDGRVCVNMFAQIGYGRDMRYTNYMAFEMCLDSLAEYVNSLRLIDYEKAVAFPYGIGCGLGGGDWNTILGLIRQFADKIDIDVVIVKKE
jgi:hypothetical protein